MVVDNLWEQRYQRVKRDGIGVKPVKICYIGLIYSFVNVPLSLADNKVSKLVQAKERA